MDIEDLQPKKAKAHAIGADITTLSVNELKALIETLQAEIALIEVALQEKQSSKSAAEAAFKR